MNKSKKIISTLGSYAGYKSLAPIWGDNDIINGGGDNTTNWIDTNEDGLADYWVAYNWAQDQTNSIVIGQRITANENNNYYKFNVYQTKQYENGKKYKIQGIIRTNATNGTFEVRNGLSGSDIMKQFSVINTDGWVNFNFEYIGGTLGVENKLYFTHEGVKAPGLWFEIDNVERLLKNIL